MGISNLKTKKISYEELQLKHYKHCDNIWALIKVFNWNNFIAKQIRVPNEICKGR